MQPHPSIPRVLGTPILPNLPHFLPFLQGNIHHVRPLNGLDANTGKSTRQAFKTLAALLAAMTADQNDVGLMYGEGVASASCTDYQSSVANGAALLWNKDFTHLVGAHSGSLFSPRARVSLLSTFATASMLAKVSANGCSFSGLQFFSGVASALPTGCLWVTGSRNHFYRCHIAGIGNDANDIAGASSLLLDGASENVFEECIIGLGTTGAGTAANAEIEFKNQASRNIFKNCLITRRLDHTSNHPLVLVTGATGIQDLNIFERCGFVSWDPNRAIAQSGVFKFSAPKTSGEIILDACYATSGTGAVVKWDVDDGNYLTLVNCADLPAADTAGLERMV